MVKTTVIRQFDVFGNTLVHRVRSVVPTKVVITAPPPKIVYTGIKVYIRPSMLVCLPQFEGVTFERTYSQRAAQINLLNNKTKGVVSDKVQNRIKNAINWLALSAQKKRVYHKESGKWFEYKLGLFTLTLPDTAEPVTASFFKEQLLQPWLAYARKYFGMAHYVVKIEPQENNKVHVHITSDTFIHHTDLRRSWNNQLRRHGLLNDFFCKFGHDNPPTEQAVSVKSVKDMAAYLSKYLVKSEKSVSDILQMEDTAADVTCFRRDQSTYTRNVSHFKKIWGNCGRLWSCNYELSNASTKSIHSAIDTSYASLQCLFDKKIQYKQILGTNKITGTVKKLGEIFFLKAANWYNDVHGELKEVFLSIINELRSGVPPADNLFYQFSPIKYETIAI